MARSPRHCVSGVWRGLLLATALAACTPSYSPDTYDSAAVQQANKVEQGEVVGVRRVAVSASGTTGAVTGAAAGGIAGSQVPSGGAGAAFGALGGGVVGGLMGAAVEHAAGDTDAFEYIVRKSNGELLSVTQRDAVPLALRQKVLVIAGRQARIVPDYTVAVDSPKPAKARDKTMPANAATSPAVTSPAVTSPAVTSPAVTSQALAPVQPVPLGQAGSPAPLAPPPASGPPAGASATPSPLDPLIGSPDPMMPWP